MSRPSLVFFGIAPVQFQLVDPPSRVAQALTGQAVFHPIGPA